MAWSNSNWITLTGQARLTALRAHIQEVSEALTPSTTSNGETYNPQHLQPYLDGLMKKEQTLSQALAGGVFAVPTRRAD